MPFYVRLLWVFSWLTAVVFFAHGQALTETWRFDDGWLLDYASRFSPFAYFFDPVITRGYTPVNVTPWNPFVFDVNLALFGFSPKPFYLHHLLTLAAVSAATYLVLRQWIAWSWALAGATLFLLGAPVARMAEQLMVGHYLYGMVFALLAIAAYTRAARTDRLTFSLAGAFSYALATTCKEVFVPLPLALVFIPAGVLRRRWRHAVPFFVWAAAYAVWRIQVLGAPVAGYSGGQFDLGSTMAQLARIPSWLFGEGALGVLALLTVLATLAAGLWVRALSWRLTVAALLLVLGPLLPLTVAPGLTGPNRYLFLPWWLVVVATVVVLARAKAGPLVTRAAVAVFLAVAAALHAQAEVAAFRPALTRSGAMYEAALAAGPNDILIVEGPGLRFWEVTLNGVRRARAAVADRRFARAKLVSAAAFAEHGVPEGYRALRYGAGCGCLRPVKPPIAGAPARAAPVPSLTVLPYGPPYPPLFPTGGGAITALSVADGEVRIEGWLPFADVDPDQVVVLITPAPPQQHSLIGAFEQAPSSVAGTANPTGRTRFALRLKYPDAAAAVAARDSCLLSLSTFSGMRLLERPDNPVCAGLARRRPRPE